MSAQLGLVLTDTSADEANVARALVRSRGDLFPPADGFEIWLLQNWRVWRAFERRADRLWAAGVKHIGGRAIGETIRYATALRERDPTFKVNDHAWPNCTRLYLLLHPERVVFETRESAKRMRVVV